MILLDSDVMIDLLRQYPPATRWLTPGMKMKNCFYLATW